MACGTPVLVSPDGGPKEVVGAFNPDYVLPSLEPIAIAARLKAFMDAGEPGKRDPGACVRFVDEGFSWERFAEGYLQWVA
jgi:glycosyltransferase involved in cell wall biosynthesis